MVLTLELAQTVAIGAFNPYVITPGWLVKYGICPKDEDINVRMVSLGDGASFFFGTINWQVDGQKLGVSSSDASVDCGDLVSKVLRLVPHTPVRAVGHNFHFVATREQWGDRVVPRLGDSGIEKLAGAEQVRWSGIFQQENARLEVSLAHEHEMIAVLFNYHRNMDMGRASRALNPEFQIAEAREAAEQFRSDYDRSRTMLRTLFGVEFTDG